ncbi:MAG: hypothetical protein RRY38_01990, partial [Oscillospiraceae bacterium]
MRADVRTFARYYLPENGLVTSLKPAALQAERPSTTLCLVSGFDERFISVTVAFGPSTQATAPAITATHASEIPVC